MAKVADSNTGWGRYMVSLIISTLIVAIGFTLMMFSGTLPGFGMVVGPTEYLKDANIWVPEFFKKEGVEGNDMLIIFNFAFLIIGYLLIAGKIWLRLIMGGFMSVVNVAYYEVITTYTDGSKESDHGAESDTLDTIFKILWIVAGFFLAPVIKFITVVARWGYTIFRCFAGKPKAPVWAVIPLFLIFSAWFFAGLFGPTYLEPDYFPEKYNTKLITETINDARSFMASNSYTYAIHTADGKKEYKPLNARQRVRYSAQLKVNRHFYVAEVSYNKVTAVTTIEISVKNNEGFLKEFDKGKNLIAPGKYTFKDGILTDSQLEGNRVIKEAGTKELLSILPEAAFARIEKLMSATSWRDRMLGKMPSVSVSEKSDIFKENMKGKASKRILISQITAFEAFGYLSLDTYAVNGKIRLNDFKIPGYRWGNRLEKQFRIEARDYYPGEWIEYK